MKVYEKDEKKQRTLLVQADNQYKLELQDIQETVILQQLLDKLPYLAPRKSCQVT